MRRARGFTLAEIMLVLAILGILVSVVVPRFTGRTEEARRQTTRVQIEDIATALDAFEYDCGRFPSAAEGLGALRQAPTAATGWKGPYLKKDLTQDPWGHPYVYAVPGRHNADFDLYSLGPDGADGDEDDLGNW